MSLTIIGPRRSPFGRYQAYVSHLRTLMGPSDLGPEWEESVLLALNGEASVELRRIASLETRRRFGAYFTGPDLSQRLIKHCASFDHDRLFYDPACGMGDLLLTAARRFPLSPTLPQTLAEWGRRLAGTDLHTEFIAGTRVRLALLARQRHRAIDIVDTSTRTLFPNIRVADGFAGTPEPRHQPMTLLLNPPFGRIKAPAGCSWATGRISKAATLLLVALENATAGTEILAILPEVLRSGSFSEHWRDRVGQLAEVHAVEPYGLFDDSADIDVFLLRLVRRGEHKLSRKKSWPKRRVTLTHTLGAHFDVHVGRVVPHRDTDTGPLRPYIHPRSVLPWTVVTRVPESRRHEARPFTPPFIAIRRTSRPSQPYRAVPSLIACKPPVAAENHLIICEPKNGSLRLCEQLMQQLKTPPVNQYLNARIRCRHLTVRAVANIPVTLT